MRCEGEGWVCLGKLNAVREREGAGDGAGAESGDRGSEKYECERLERDGAFPDV